MPNGLMPRDRKRRRQLERLAVSGAYELRAEQDDHGEHRDRQSDEASVRYPRHDGLAIVRRITGRHSWHVIEPSLASTEANSRPQRMHATGLAPSRSSTASRPRSVMPRT